MKSVDESVLLSGPFILAAITTALIYSFLCSAIFNGEILKQPNAGTKSEFLPVAQYVDVTEREHVFFILHVLRKKNLL